MTRFLLAIIAAVALANAEKTFIYKKTDGVFNVGLVLPIHRLTSAEEGSKCGEIDQVMLAQTTLFVNLIEAINKHDGILPNVTLGYSIFDSCADPDLAIERISTWVGSGNVSTSDEARAGNTTTVSSSNMTTAVPANTTTASSSNTTTLSASNTTTASSSNTTTVSASNATTAASFNTTTAATPGTSHEIKSTHDKPVFFAGGYNSRVTAPVAKYLGGFEIPFIDYSATVADLSNRTEYPLFARTSSSDANQATAMAEIAHLLNNTCVHLLYSEGIYGERGAESVRESLAARNICIAGDVMLPTGPSQEADDEMFKVVQGLKNQTGVTTLVCFCEDTTFKTLFGAIRRHKSESSKTPEGTQLRYSFIGGDYWAKSLQVRGFEDIVNGAISISQGTVNTTSAVILDSEKLMEKLQGGNAHPWLQEFYSKKFGCDASSPNGSCDYAANRLVDENIAVNDGAENFYISVMAGVQALHTALFNQCPDSPLSGQSCVDGVRQMSGQDYYKLIIGQQVDVSEFKHETPFKFTDNGEGLPTYTFNYFHEVFEGTYQYSSLATYEGEVTNIDKGMEDLAKQWPGTEERKSSSCSC